MAADSAIVTRGLTKRYEQVLAVDSLDLDVARGEIFGLLGPNGAGKTTTILMLLGLSEPTAGTVSVAGFDPTRQPIEVKRRVGYLPDNVGFYGSMSGRANLLFTAALNGLDEGAARSRVDELLRQVGLGRSADDRVDTYSRGMRQRLGIADALVKDPEIVILDEPTVNIDPSGVTEMLDLIRSLARDRGVTVLLSSHLLHQVQSICDRVGIFVSGRLVASGRVRDLARQVVTEEAVFEVGVDGVEPADIIDGLPGVKSVEGPDGVTGLTVVRATPEFPEHLSRALGERSVSLSHLRRLDHELDELYRRYFEQQETADAGAAG